MKSYEFAAANLDTSAGFREGPRGTHTSRTSMAAELERVLRTGAHGDALEKLVLDANVLEKATMAGRALTLQRLKELYALDNVVPVFRVLSDLWGSRSRITSPTCPPGGVGP